MAAVSRGQLVTDIREYMDSTGSGRWSDTLIKAVAASVFDAEWSNILNAAPYYTFARRSVSADSAGQIPFSALNAGTGDAAQTFYRVISVNDGSMLYTETRFQDVPLAVTAQYQPAYGKAYYFAGEAIQLLPAVAQDVTVACNWKPTGLLDLASDTSTITFPDASHFILVWEAAAQLLVKGGAEAGPASVLRGLASADREAMLDDIRRRSIYPTRLGYPDSASDWSGQ